MLVVEDQDGVRRLLARQLRRAGFEVTLAGDGEAALALLEERPERIELLVTDVTMPRLGGAGLADRLRIRWPDLRVAQPAQEREWMTRIGLRGYRHLPVELTGTLSPRATEPDLVQA